MNEEIITHEQESQIETMEPITTVHETSVRESPIYDLINKRKEKILPSLHGNESEFYKMARSFTTTIHRNKLESCNPQSILDAFIKCCDFGLDPSGALGLIHLIPYKGSISLQVGYQGWLKLLWNNKKVLKIDSGVIYVGDEFEYINGATTIFSHKKNFKSKDMIMTYAYAKLIGDEMIVRIADLDDIEKSKKASPTSKSTFSPWNNFEDRMAEIVPLRQLGKILAVAINDYESDFDLSKLTLEGGIS